MGKQQLSDAAFMQSISENKIIRKYCSKHNPPVTFDEIHKAYKGSKDPDMQLFNEFYKNNANKGFVIRDYSDFGTDKGHSVLITATKSKDVYVAFDGTNNAEWKDNGIGLCCKESPQQVYAKDRFDNYVKAFGLTEDDNIVVAGHSKGGNKAMYVTMESENSHLIDKCVALDGQGFSPEAVDYWKNKYGSNYDDVVNKITLVRGKNDFVNQLGITIAGQTYTIGYEDWCGVKESGSNYLFSCHDHRWMFRLDNDGNLILNTSDKPGPQDALLKEFMREYMALSAEDRAKSAPKLMNLIQMLVNGELDKYGADKLIKDIDDLLVILSETPSGSALVQSLIRFIEQLLTMSVVGNNLILKAALETYLASVQARAWYNAMKQRDKQNNNNSSHNNNGHTVSNPNTTITGSGNNGNNAVSSGAGSSQQIVLNKEAFEALYGRFDTVFSYAIEGTMFSEKAEALECDLHICGALAALINLEATSIKVLLQSIVESFTSTDNKLKEEAEKILGNEIYTAVSNGQQVIVNPDGSYTIGSAYSNAVQNYIRDHLQELLGINHSNRGNLGISEPEWCDSFVDYIIRASGMKSAGRYNSQTTEVMENYGLRHGYDTGFDWSSFNNTYNANVSNDGYKPQTGDLVYVNWANSNTEATQHVGIIYIDPETNQTMVLDGNSGTSKITRYRPFDEFIQGARHVSFADMSTYNALVSSGQI